jgi:VWFA-related protein
LIDLNVIALDGHGQPVTDLKPDEMQVTDAGKPQKLSLFRRIGGELRQVEPLSPNQFTNRVNGEAPHATVLLFDLMNEGFSSRGVASNEIVRNLQTLESADSLYFYILTINGRLVAVRALPEEGATPSEPGAPPWTKQIKPVMDQALHALTVNRSADIDVALRVQMTYTMLEDLGEQLARIPGRKNVVWVTDGVPIALGAERSDAGVEIDFTPYLRKLAESLDRSGVALYPVRQVMLGSPDEIGAESGVGETGGKGTGAQSIATLDEFANVTGGRPSTDKDIGHVVQQAMIDARSSYQIGYYPPANNWDGKFHKIKVTCKRKGIRIQVKTGYFAVAEPVGTRAADAFAATSQVAYDAGEIGLRATVTGDQVSVRIDAGDVAMAQDGDRYRGQLRIETVGYTEEGRMETSAVVPLDFRFDSNQRDQALKSGIDYAQNLKLQGETKFRVIVFDRSSNSVGSVTIPARALQAGQTR